MAEGAGVRMEIRPEGLGDVKRRLQGAIALVHKPSRLMKAIGAALVGSTRRRFRAGVAPDGTPWKPSLRAKLKGGKTLIQSTRLLRSITSDGDDQRAAVGTNLVYAQIHQQGGVITAKGDGWLKFQIPGIGWRQVRSVKIPARPYLGVSNDDREEISDQVRRHLERAVA